MVNDKDPESVCAVCNNKLSSPPEGNGSEGGGGDGQYDKPSRLSQAPCGHTFHTHCVLTWIQPVSASPDYLIPLHGPCPVCKNLVTELNLIPFPMEEFPPSSPPTKVIQPEPPQNQQDKLHEKEETDNQDLPSIPEQDNQRPVSSSAAIRPEPPPIILGGQGHGGHHHPPVESVNLLPSHPLFLLALLIALIVHLWGPSGYEMTMIPNDPDH